MCLVQARVILNWENNKHQNTTDSFIQLTGFVNRANT